MSAARPFITAYVALALSTSSIAQPTFIPIDHRGEPASSSIVMLPQQGQLADEYGDVRDEVLYYSYSSNPKLYVLDNNSVSLALTARDTIEDTPDSVYHLNMRFAGEMANPFTIPEPYEVTTERHNYFLGHCSDGVLNVPGFKRLVYKQIYPGIDFHIYSNPWGPKFYFVIAPGANPSLIRLLFTGQHELGIDAYGFLKARLGGQYIQLRQALAYQQAGGTTQPVSMGLAWDLLSSDQVGFVFGAYNSSLPLILDLSASFAPPANDPVCLVWSSFFGDTDHDAVSEMTTATNGALFACGTTFSPFFPASQGAYDPSLGGTRDAYYSHFSSDYEHLYTTFYGGIGVENGNSIALSADEQSVYLFGNTSSTDLGTTAYSTSAFRDSTGGPSTCFVARFSLVSIPVGQPDWRTYFGSNMSGCSCLRTDEDDNVYITGHAGSLGTLTVEPICDGTTGTFPVCNAIGTTAYFQGYFAGGNTDAYLAKFDADLNLVHSTLFGGYNTDQSYGMAVDNVRNEVYLVGNTSSKRYANANCQPPSSPNFGFPLCSVPGGYFDNNLNAVNTDGLNDGYLACFSTLDGAMLYSSYIAGDADELGSSVAVNEQDGKVYMAGVTPQTTYASASCTAPNGVGFPNCSSAGQFHPPYGGGSFDIYLVKLDASTRAMEWTAFLGGGGYDAPGQLSVDDQGQLVIGGITGSGSNSTNPVPVLQNPLFYYQPDHADASAGIDQYDGMVYLFSPTNTLVYGSYFGGIGTDGCNARRHGLDKLYLAGTSKSTADFPFECPPTPNPYCFSSYSNISPTASDCFYAQVQCAAYVGIEEGQGNSSNSTTFYVDGSGQVVVEVPLTGSSSNVALSIWDARGRLVAQGLRSDASGNTSLKFSPPPIGRGLYLLSVTDPSGQIIAAGKLSFP